MTYKVTDGILDLCGETPGDAAEVAWQVAVLRQCTAWLKVYYARTGQDVGQLRSHVMAFAHEYGLLHEKGFAWLLHTYTWRLQHMQPHIEMGAANDFDPLLGDVSRRKLRHIPTRQLNPRHMASVVWPPFKIVSRVRLWGMDELIASVRRSTSGH